MIYIITDLIISNRHIYTICPGHTSVKGKSVQDLKTAVQFRRIFLAGQLLVPVENIFGSHRLIKSLQCIKRSKNLGPSSDIHTGVPAAEGIKTVMPRSAL